jgi:hypothetical protein
MINRCRNKTRGLLLSVTGIRTSGLQTAMISCLLKAGPAVQSLQQRIRKKKKKKNDIIYHQVSYRIDVGS